MKPRNYIIVLWATLACIIALCLYQNEVERENIFTKLENDYRTLQGHADKLKQENETYRAQIGELTRQIEQAQTKASRGGERGTKLSMEVTAYDLSYASCGKLPNHPAYGITASGQPVQEWYTIAASRGLPFGTRVYIPYFKDKPNGGVFVVQDRGRAITEGHLDVYMADNAEAMEFGRRELDVWVLKSD